MNARCTELAAAAREMLDLQIRACGHLDNTEADMVLTAIVHALGDVARQNVARRAATAIKPPSEN
ncbi:MAG: hypothetical protein NUW01_14325 [Gemmatimonadaceae bacterium]|nr:hypothetical protein [Gemmatimonadaceae bacterium]